MPKVGPWKTPSYYRYSGDSDECRQFWSRVNQLKGGDHQEVYALGCVLQNLESSALAALQRAEDRVKFKKGRAA